MSERYPGSGGTFGEPVAGKIKDEYSLQWDYAKQTRIRDVLRDLEGTKEVKLYNICLVMLKQLEEKIGL